MSALDPDADARRDREAEERRCQWCGNPYTDRRRDALYCSDEHGAAARRARQTARRRIRSALTAMERLAEVATTEDWAELESGLLELAERVVAQRERTG